ncbi:uncharacterized protein yc1106_05813 [Curvularia clavata]|uniref:A to I editase domain-containing protein n=1 Tax=Curvularia clavata TaxID=95742 RepID=A0A9Q8Z9K4_CURCL|nr:uncharacterized protein yc1106_05813 [Curvularia clavata]
MGYGIVESTGMKCLPSNKLPLAKGNILHDWHAEVIAIRAFNRYLLDECARISSSPYPTSDFIQSRGAEESTLQQFTIRDDVLIHMYCSEAPCGDASMELTMAMQADATPWTSAPPTLQEATLALPSQTQQNLEAAAAALASPSPTSEDSPSITEPSALRGRSNFSHLGVVRAKPSRPDAPPTLSKSCTDKLTLKQCTSLLSSSVSLLISPENAYLTTLILPNSQYIPSAISRAFSPAGRLKNLSTDRWASGYSFRPFEVKPTSREFDWCRRKLGEGEKALPSNISAVWTPHWQETLIGGVLQGRKQMDPRGASRISRRGLWGEGVRVGGLLMERVRVAGLVSATAAAVTLLGSKKSTYDEMKHSEMLEARRRVKNHAKTVLKGWIKNAGDDDWHLE